MTTTSETASTASLPVAGGNDPRRPIGVRWLVTLSVIALLTLLLVWWRAPRFLETEGAESAMFGAIFLFVRMYSDRAQQPRWLVLAGNVIVGILAGVVRLGLLALTYTLQTHWSIAARLGAWFPAAFVWFLVLAIFGIDRLKRGAWRRPVEV